MSQITADMIKTLRERTGVGMAKCKKALEEASGDMDLAIENLRKAGMASAVKKEGREANEGLIGAGESDKAVALIEINSETDFVANNDKFKQYLKDMAEEVALSQPADLDAFLAQKCEKDPSLTVDEYRALMVQTLGENIQIRRLTTLDKASDISIGVYSHMGGRIVTAVVINGAASQEALARDIAMHIAAEAPEFLSPADIPADVKAREEDIAKSQIKGKPENIVDKIVAGKLQAFYDSVCLLGQKFVKDPSMNVEQLLEKESKAAGKPLKVEKFLRWQIGA